MREVYIGISAFYHDSAAAITIDGRIMAAAQEERFTRRKHDSSFPENALRYVLDEAAIDVSEIKAVVFYDKPFLKFERLLETYHAFAPSGLKSFVAAIPVWIKEKLFMRKMITDALRPFDLHQKKLLFPEHHLSHAASAFYPSPFEEAAILTIDGVGEWATTTIAHGRANGIKIHKEIHFPHSIGLLYSAFTYFLGFRVNSGEYKLMGLAPYGDAHAADTKKYLQIIEKELIDIREDGSYVLNMKYFTYATGLKMTRSEKWKTLFGFGPRAADEKIEQHHCNLALAIQQLTEKAVLKLAQHAKEVTGSKNITLSGGVALNSVANGKLLKSGMFNQVWIQPASGDAGGAVGAALAAHYIFGEQKRTPEIGDSMQGSLLGPAFSKDDIQKVIRKFSASAHLFESLEVLNTTVAKMLDEGKIAGWFNGRMEYGPRALGNRSILADARNPEMQRKLNLKIKYREGFRPFAPAVAEEDVAEYFSINEPSPYMLMVVPVQEKRQISLPSGYNKKPLYEKLYFQRSDIPAVTHVDYSARLQTVSKKTNPEFHSLLMEFKKQTGYSVLINTSFNVRGEPIVCSPEEAYLCFMHTEMDILVLENFLFLKEEQPGLPEKFATREFGDD